MKSVDTNILNAVKSNKITFEDTSTAKFESGPKRPVLKVNYVYNEQYS